MNVTALFVVVLMIVGMLVVAAVAALALKIASGSSGGPYQLQNSLFTAAEQTFLIALDRALPLGVRVFGKVRLGDIFAVRSGLSQSDWHSALNRINRKHVDFLLVRAGDLVPLAGIELDDRSHEALDRLRRDAFVDQVFAGAGLPLLHVRVQRSYDVDELRARIGGMVAPAIRGMRPPPDSTPSATAVPPRIVEAAPPQAAGVDDTAREVARQIQGSRK